MVNNAQKRVRPETGYLISFRRWGHSNVKEHCIAQYSYIQMSILPMASKWLIKYLLKNQIIKHCNIK